MIGGLERGGLFGKLINQVLTGNLRMGRDIENRLFGIKRAALPANHIERINDMCFKPQHSGFENGEKPDRASANYGDIGAVRCV